MAELYFLDEEETNTSPTGELYFLDEEQPESSPIMDAGKRAMGGLTAFWDIPGSLAEYAAKMAALPGAAIAGALDPHSRPVDVMKEVWEEEKDNQFKPSSYFEMGPEVRRGYDAANQLYDLPSKLGRDAVGLIQEEQAKQLGKPTPETAQFLGERIGEFVGGSVPLTPGLKAKGVLFPENKPKPLKAAEAEIAQREFQVYMDKLSKGKDAEAQIARERFYQATQGELFTNETIPTDRPYSSEGFMRDENGMPIDPRLSEQVQADIRREQPQGDLFSDPYAAPVFERRNVQGGELPMPPRREIMGETIGARVDPNDPFTQPFMGRMEPSLDPTQTPPLGLAEGGNFPRPRVEGRFAPKDPGHLNIPGAKAPDWTLTDDSAPSFVFGQESILSGLDQFVNSNDIQGGLNHIAKNSTNPFFRMIASALSRLNLKDVGIGVNKNLASRGAYHANINTIEMAPHARWDPHTYIHETAHAATLNQIRKWEAGSKNPHITALDKLFRNLKSKGIVFVTDQGLPKVPYGFTNLREFVAEGLSNPSFADILDNTPLSKAEKSYINGKYLQSWWDALVDFVRKILKMPVEQHNALDVFLKQAIEVLRETNPDLRNYEINLNANPTAHMADKADPHAGNKPTTVTNAFVVKGKGGHTIYDNRNAQEFVMGEDWSKVEDLNVGKVGQHFFQGGNISAVARRTPMVRWLYNKVQAADRKASLNSHNLLNGNTYRKNFRGWDKKQRKDYTGMITWMRENQNNKQGQQVFELIKKLDADQRDLTPQDMEGMTAAQKQAVQAIRSGFDKIQRDLNASAMQNDHAPIGFIKGYFPHQMLGDYMVMTKKDGKTVKAYPARNEKEAKTLAEDLQAQFPDLDITHVPRKSRYDINDVTAFRETLGLLEKSSPEYKVVDRAYNQVLAHRGFAKQGLRRKGHSAYFGEKSAKDMVDATELYVNRAYRFIANMEKRKHMADLRANMKQYGHELANYPNAEKYMSDYLDNSTGALKNQLEVLDNIGEYLGTQGGKYGLSDSQSFRKTVGQLGSLASLYFLTTPKFLLTNIVQHAMVVPKLNHLRAQLNVGDSVVLNMGAMYKELFFPSKQTIDAINYAKKHGYLDSKIADLLGTTLEENNVRELGKFTKDKITGIFGWQDQEMVRTPAYIAFERILRKAIPEKELRYQTAGELTSTYMMNYTRNERPLMYGKSGMLGQAMAPLKTYMHGYYGQFLEYLQAIKEDKTAKPLATFLGIQAFMSGMSGMLFVKEYDDIAKRLNSMFGDVLDFALPTMEEHLITHDYGDALTFGGVSAITGIDMSGSLSAPAGNSLLSMPGIGLAGGMAMDAGNLAGKTIRGTQGDADVMRTLTRFSPNIFHGWIEDAYTQPGMGPPDPYNNMNPQVSKRNTEDRVIRNFIGGRSTKEAREMAQKRAVKNEDQRFRGKKKEITDAIVDRLVKKQDVKSLIERYKKYGGDGDELSSAVVERLRQRNMDFALRYLGKNPSPDRAMRLQKFRMLIEKADQQELINNIQELERLNGRSRNP